MSRRTGLFHALPPGPRETLRGMGEEKAFATGDRLFEEGTKADRFWVVRTGSVTLDMHVPGRRSVIMDTIGHGELLGWSWLFPPYEWQMGAEATSPLRTLEFDAAEVRTACQEDAELGRALTYAVADVIGQRLQRTRGRLIDVFGPYGWTRPPQP